MIHLAAQPLVRESYRDPRDHVETNVDGHLQRARGGRGDRRRSRAHVVVTTDKVYRNVNQVGGYREADPLGGARPVQRLEGDGRPAHPVLDRRASPAPPTAIARAGNVIGGGDVCADRLLPDLIARVRRGRARPHPLPGRRPAVAARARLPQRLPHARRRPARRAAGTGEWNFGPGPDSFVTVGQVADLVAASFGAPAGYDLAERQPTRGRTSGARLPQGAASTLGWRNRLGFEQALEWTVEWERAASDGQDLSVVTRTQLGRFWRNNQKTPPREPAGTGRRSSDSACSAHVGHSLLREDFGSNSSPQILRISSTKSALGPSPGDAQRPAKAATSRGPYRASHPR